ncbi:MAG TPA: hypothetical protein VKB03_13385 [Conexibacter sp.]|nr:hypothetical protein [Conexibacter sp.]
MQRLISAGEFEAERLPSSHGLAVSVDSIVAFEQRRHAAREASDRAARNLDRLGAPLE